MAFNSTSLKFAISFAFHIIAIVLSVMTLKPNTLPVHPRLAAELLSGRDNGYQLPGSQFKIFQPILPKKGSASLIYDRPCPTDAKSKQFCHDAQKFLTPFLLSMDTQEPIALVYCSSAELAEKRLAETGYRWAYNAGKGRGIARRMA
ncbi:MAG: hypothetical protein A2Y02_03160 [Omnitrophica bacterium GWA2_52_12]|nr:MAG: hypothetical protein A2Y02_03160 [Omnitrophica bacterium GWA2_52_12]